jgi:hypothetical protein
MTFINQFCLASAEFNNISLYFQNKITNDIVSIILSTMTVQEMVPRDPIYPENHIFILPGSFQAQILSILSVCTLPNRIRCLSYLDHLKASFMSPGQL